MKNCLICKKEIPDQYIYCAECAVKEKKEKEVSKEQNNKDIIAELSKINNNLYFLRTAFAILLKKEYKTEIISDKGTYKAKAIK